MTLLPDQRSVVDDIIADAVASATRSGDQIDHALAEVDRLAGGGIGWADDYLHALARRGMAAELADWRRRQRKVARTAKGAEVEAPEFGGVRRADDDGHREFHQLSLADLTPDEMEQWIGDQQKSRDTISRKIQWAKDALAIAREIGCERMGPAIVELERRHA